MLNIHTLYKQISFSWQENNYNFPYFAPYWAPKGDSPFIWTNLNPHPPNMFPTKFDWNWPSGSRLKEKVNRRTDGRTDAGKIEIKVKNRDFESLIFVISYATRYTQNIIPLL